jgi:hypothetical protein
MAIKRGKVFRYLDQFLAAEKAGLPLPKPRAVVRALHMNRGTVYFYYSKWRSLHADDYRVKAHRRKYGQD